MTALKPIESRSVRGVPSTRYPINRICAHPECSEPAVDPHHTFPRSQIGNDSWFVEILDHEADTAVNTAKAIQVIPHVTGLCRAHHDDVELHKAWIKLEDGVFVWYDRKPFDETGTEFEGADSVELLVQAEWEPLAPLNPQPGSVEGKAKRRKFQGEAKRKRKTISLRVPDDAGEDGAGLLTDLIDQLEERISGTTARPAYYTLVDALNWTLLNSDSNDFGGGE